MQRGLLLALAACGPTSMSNVDAGGDAAACTGMEFSLGERLEGNVGGGHDPSTTGDPLELWYSRTGIVATYDVEGARRANDGAPYDASIAFDYNKPGIDRDPALSADGLVLAFTSDTSGTLQPYESRRATTTESFGAPVLLPLAQAAVDNGIELSADGLTLYFADDRRDLRSVRRSDRSSPFGAASEILSQNVENPTLSSDELELYYSRADDTKTYRRTRRNREGAFDDNETEIFADALEPDLSPDGQRLYVVRSGDVYTLTRNCD